MRGVALSTETPLRAVTGSRRKKNIKNKYIQQKKLNHTIWKDIKEQLLTAVLSSIFK